MPSSAVHEHQVVPVDDFPLVRRSELAGQITCRPAQEPGKLGHSKVDQPAGDHVAVFVEKVDGITRLELAVDRGDACRQQREPAIDDRAYGAGVEAEPPERAWPRAPATAAGSGSGRRSG